MSARHSQRFYRVFPVALILFAQIANADWTSFRNGGDSQSASELPVNWTSSEGVAWQTELIGYGQSTPVVMEGKVYVTAVEGTMKESCVIQCFDLNSGEELWKFAFDAANQTVSNYAASRAAPTPIVDAQAVYAFFESGDVLAVDHTGKKLWHRDLTKDYGSFENNHGLGSSPVKTPDHLIINIEHRGPSYLIAFAIKTGETQWKVERPSSSSWSSPIAVDSAQGPLVIVSSGGSVIAYDSATGEQVWDVGGLNGNSVPSPTLQGTRLLVGARLPEFSDENGGNQSNCCIDLANMADGKPGFLWRADRVTSDYASPVVCGEFVYYISKAGVLYCLDLEGGQIHYSKRLGTQCWATPIVSGDKIYFFGKDGKTLVLSASKEFKITATNELWDPANPPRPETYVEGTRGERASTGEDAEGNAESGRQSGRGGRRPGGGMMAALTAADKDGDGRLSADEIPADFKPMLASIDKNGDGSLDQEEIKAVAESFAARRADSASDARDPIVYGAVASNGKILIRTGTRLYCIE